VFSFLGDSWEFLRRYLGSLGTLPFWDLVGIFWDFNVFGTFSGDMFWDLPGTCLGLHLDAVNRLVVMQRDPTTKISEEAFFCNTLVAMHYSEEVKGLASAD
jgi:hypothetical protein